MKSSLTICPVCGEMLFKAGVIDMFVCTGQIFAERMNGMPSDSEGALLQFIGSLATGVRPVGILFSPYKNRQTREINIDL